MCASTVWTQHAYIGGEDPVERGRATALAARGCPQPHTIWITETGVGAGAEGVLAAIVDRRRAAGCRALHDRLVQWFNDPRVTVAFQYTVREDDKFPTGLFCTDLTERARRSPSGPRGAAGAHRPRRRRHPPLPKRTLKGPAPVTRPASSSRAWRP